MANRNLSLAQLGRITDADPGAVTHHRTFRIWDQGGGFITAHHGTAAGGVVGALSVFPGKPTRLPSGEIDNSSNINGGVIYGINVDEKHRGKGIATAMLNHARARYPDWEVRHSTALSEEGAAFAKARP
jgi:GNAT superfamily N-acetyltransferase